MDSLSSRDKVQCRPDDSGGNSITTAEKIAQYCLKKLNLQDARLSEEYFYHSLPFCIVDAVYSIGVTYTGTRNTVQYFCNRQNLHKLRAHGSPYPDISEQYSIADFEKLLSGYDDYSLVAEDVFNNRQRTSSRNGILKAEAVHRFARVLMDHHVNYYQDIPAVIKSDRFESAICLIPGQRSGISLKYFFMLAGEKNLIKPDRWIRIFLTKITGIDLSLSDAQLLLSQALEILKETYPELTLRELDHEIWKYESTGGST